MPADAVEPEPTDPDAIDAATRAVDERDSVHGPGADRAPTPEEELAAERAAPDDATLARAAAAYRDAAEHGVEQEGEGRIE